MTDILSLKEVKKEWLYWLRNSDIFSVADRGVSTTTDEGTFAADSTHLIAKTNIKNIRSIVVGGSTLSYGKDYTYKIDFSDTTIKTKITFTSAQTGVYVITYDYGPDKIYPDFPRPDLTLDSFPRMGFDFITANNEAGGFGGVLKNDITITTIIYAEKTEDLFDYISDLRALIVAAYHDFYYVGKYVKPTSVGPVLKSPFEKGKDKIFQQNIDIQGEFYYDKP